MKGEINSSYRPLFTQGENIQYAIFDIDKLRFLLNVPEGNKGGINSGYGPLFTQGESIQYAIFDIDKLKVLIKCS